MWQHDERTDNVKSIRVNGDKHNREEENKKQLNRINLTFKDVIPGAMDKISRGRREKE